MSISQYGLRKAIKSVTEPVKLDHPLRICYTELSLLGERLMFSIKGRPDPSTAIFLAGSARSGTTWLENILTAIPRVQPIFEPLLVSGNAHVHRFAADNNPFENYFSAVYLRADADHPEWKNRFTEILTGRVRSYWTDYDRCSYFPKRFLIKEVRANMMLGYLHTNFQPRVIYLVRHPCAVIASRISEPVWRADVRDILKQEELVESYLRPWIGAIEREKDLVGAHAVWWAVENKVAETQLAQFEHAFIFFEELLLDPQKAIRDIYGWLAVPMNFSGMASKITMESRTASSSYVNKGDRLSRWKQKLPTDDQARILRWADRLGLKWYSSEALPVHMVVHP